MEIKYNQEITKNGLTYSIDMVRLSLKTSIENGQAFLNALSIHELDIGLYDYYQSFKVFQYRHLFTIREIGSSSVTIGLMPNDDKRVECVKGYIEFNPNKVSSDKKFRFLMDLVSIHFQEINVKRWDLAIDIPCQRECAHLRKDNRNYVHILGHGETEYLGRRSHDGFVKLYDKTKESELSTDVTRLEITIEGVKTFNDVNFPKVYIVSQQLNLKGKMELSGTDLVLVELLQFDDDLERHLRMMGRRKCEKIRPYLLGEDTVLQLDEAVYNTLLTYLRVYYKSQLL